MTADVPDGGQAPPPERTSIESSTMTANEQISVLLECVLAASSEMVPMLWGGDSTRAADIVRQLCESIGAEFIHLDMVTIHEPSTITGYPVAATDEVTGEPVVRHAFMGVFESMRQDAERVAGGQSVRDRVVLVDGLPRVPRNVLLPMVNLMASRQLRSEWDLPNVRFIAAGDPQDASVHHSADQVILSRWVLTRLVHFDMPMPERAEFVAMFDEPADGNGADHAAVGSEISARPEPFMCFHEIDRDEFVTRCDSWRETIADFWRQHPDIFEHEDDRLPLSKDEKNLTTERGLSNLLPALAYLDVSNRVTDPLTLYATLARGFLGKPVGDLFSSYLSDIGGT